MKLETVASLDAVSPGEWNALAGTDPFVGHEFLSALERTACVGTSAGWTPTHLVLRDRRRLEAAMPLYLKTHSYGEYVFDWAWADAYHRHGIDYYPKLVCAVPFTPVTGPRLLAHKDEHRHILVAGLLQLARELKVSSAHVLFPCATDEEALLRAGMLARRGVQFHWRNDGYACFDDFLAAMNHAKRKNIRQERRKVRDAGITFEWLEGAQITEADWMFFSKCYRNTYRAHGSRPYLSLQFFRELGAALPAATVLIVARRDGRRIAASFNVRAAERLYGRYWGSVEYESGLHFETCYYQVIEYCISRGIAVFEGGAQGEHKMARGLLPVETRSAHWLAHPQFAEAVEAFLAREGRGMAHYMDELREHTPFRRDAAS
ncbi:MAG: GNAT family N-acetyltransferase [Rhodospirillaceae bacterium]